MSKNKLLLADDSITIQKVVNLTFADEGIEVVAVGDGDTALEKIQESAPDLIMADVNMPGLSGYQICEQIKRNPQLKDIPVILLVGSFEPFDEAEAQRVGADDFMTKPFQSIRQLVVKVTDLLGRKNSSAEINQTQDFVDTLPDLNERLEAENNPEEDDEMIQTAHYEESKQVPETTKLSSAYLNRINDFETEQPYGNFQTGREFTFEDKNEFSEPAARFDDEKEAEETNPANIYEAEIVENEAVGGEYPQPAIYDFDYEKTKSVEDVPESDEGEKDKPHRDEFAAEHFAAEPSSEIAQKAEDASAAEPEKISAPPSAAVLKFDDFDLLELPPLKTDAPETVEVEKESAPPENAAPVNEIAETVHSEIASSIENSDTFAPAPQLSPDAIEAIAQKVFEKLSEKFFKKED